MTAPASTQQPTPPSSGDRLPPMTWSDMRIVVMLGHVLRFGVVISAATVLCGASIYLAVHGTQPANYRVFQGEPSDFRTISGVLRGAARGHGRGLIQLGLLLLIATPIARVLFSVAGFLLERDRLYVIFTLIVLTVLLYSLLGSRMLL